MQPRQMHTQAVLPAPSACTHATILCLARGSRTADTKDCHALPQHVSAAL